MKWELEIIVASNGRYLFPVNVKIFVHNEKCYLEISDIRLGDINLIANDFFNCLIDVRLILEKQNLFVLCKGSMKNVNISRMLSQMAHGRKAYTLEMGKSASLENIVDIFDFTPIESVATVEEQKQFYRDWTQALKLGIS